jgi:pilus assembly protein FimV
MARKLAAVAFSLGLFHASSLMALGLGEMQLESFLNEPLKASVDLLNMGELHEDEIRVRLATTEDFDKLGLERAYFLTTVTFEVVSNGQGGAQILIRSEEPVLEPYLDFVVEARWPSGRLLREYTVLVDPPVFSQSTPVVSASERVSATEGAAPADGVPAPVDYNELYQSRSSRVDMRGLAAGDAPQREYTGSSAGAPAPGSRYTIRRDQTLWEIASQAKPPGTSVHQMMLDIQRLNPDAFINGNINRIKAGYVIYLPTAQDISSGDVSTALAEVREQNQAWREGRDNASYTSRGPSLRISAEPEAADAAQSSAPGRAGTETAQAGESQQPTSSADTAAAKAAAELPASDTQARLAALEQQLETLQRIVSLKDDQIAALQNALADAGAAVPEVGSEQDTTQVVEGAAVVDGAEVAEVTEEVTPATSPEVAESPTDVAEAEVEAVAVPPAVEGEQVAGTTEVKKSEEPAPKKSSPTPAAAETGEGWSRYLPYVLGALVLAVAGLVIARRRSEVDDGEDDEPTLPIRQATVPKDVFADVRLQDQNLEVVPVMDEPAFVDDGVPSMRDNRGYGERKHDEYASDVDAADALAEADIYIAYGRHPQAIDLLNNALASEPGNPVYRLKLLEIYAELDNRVAATAQLRKIEAIGDAEAIARAEVLMERLSGDEELELPTTVLHTPVSRGPGLSPNPLQMLTDSNEALEEDFSGLEIEEHFAPGEEDDLDLSGDFAVESSLGDEDEELVIAADSNALSTKLDLARAYLDMGDDDGARQILDEVVAEGTEDLKAEAQALLSRIG